MSPDAQPRDRLAGGKKQRMLHRSRRLSIVHWIGRAEPPFPNWTAIGVTWLAGFDFEIKVIARIPDW